MAEFGLGVLGSLLASCIVALVTYIVKYARRGKKLEQANTLLGRIYDEDVWPEPMIGSTHNELREYLGREE